MKIEELDINGVFLIQPRRVGDTRGYFMETFKLEDFQTSIGDILFIQENESKSNYGVIRGLHLQRGEFAQAKLVRAVIGRVLDVIVDLRQSSPTFGKHIAIELSEENARQLFIPRGMAHGFAVLSETAVFSYKVDNVYAPQEEITLDYNDSCLGIDWQISPEKMLLSEKDKKGIPLNKIYTFK